MAFLLWVRGPAFNLALTVFVLGMTVRLLEIFMLGRRPNYAEPKGPEFSPGMNTVLNRFAVNPGVFARAPFNVVVGYLWHIGFLACLFLFIPHIELARGTFGLSWPGLPNPLVDALSVITLVSLIAVLIHRSRHPVMRHLATLEDTLVWIVTFLPLLTGYLAYHRAITPYPVALGLHILSVELLMVTFPFTRLTHAFTALIARWYNGAAFGRKGVQS
ncbi:Nitrate reductase gamma subunit [Gammaproteobacteria bacterium]